jgi:hypothetical protein
MSDEKKIVITKVGDTPSAGSKPKSKPKHEPSHRTKNATRSSLKVKGVRDPSKSPPLKKGMHKHTLRVFTERGNRKQHKTLRRKLSSMKTEDVQKKLKESGLLTNDKTPPNISKQILEHAVSAGFISLS